jgi:hypothetical protein
MSIKKKILIIIPIIILYFIVNNLISADPDSKNKLTVFLRNNIDSELRYKIKQNLFPIARYKSLYENEKTRNNNNVREINSNLKEIQELRQLISSDFIKNYRSGEIDKIPFYKQDNMNFNFHNYNYELEIFDTNLLFNGKHDGALLGTSAYIDEYLNNIIISTGDGIILYINHTDLKKNKFNSKIIRSNLTDLILDKKVYEKSKLGIKDILIKNNEIYLSYSNNVNECYNTSILKAEINLDFLKFEKFFEPKNCANKYSDYFFNPHSSGGKMILYDENNIIFTQGDYYYWPAPQNINNHLGKILMINLKNSEAKILSMGHRNPQGLYLDKKNNLLISTEHGPVGGDEINLNYLNDSSIKNFGWPVSSYGEHHCKEKFEKEGKNGLDCPDYKLAPLYKSHDNHGYIEPLKYWVPSIGITEIYKSPNNFLDTSHNEFFIGALGNNINEGDLSLHHVTLDQDYQNVISENTLKIFQRIRDINYSKKLNKIIVFLETKGSIGLLSVKKN